MLEWKSHALRASLITRLERSHIPDDSFGLLIDGSFGDVFLTLSFIDSFYLFHRSKVVVFISERYAVFAKIYVREWLRFLLVEDTTILRASIAGRGVPLLERGLLYPTLPTMHPLIAEAMSSARMSELDIRSLILGLPKGASYGFPHLPVELVEQLDSDMNRLGCDLGMAVLFSPVTNTIKNFSHEYIENILKTLTLFGEVVTNVSEADPGLVAIASKYGLVYSVPPHGLIHVSDRIGRHVIITSGMMSLLSIFESNCRFLHIIPAESSGIVMNNGLSTYGGLYSVRGPHKCTPVNDITEVWLPPETEDFPLDQFREWFAYCPTA